MVNACVFHLLLLLFASCQSSSLSSLLSSWNSSSSLVQVDRREFAKASSALKPEVLRQASKRAAAAAAAAAASLTTTTNDQPLVDASSSSSRSRKMKLSSSHATPDTSMDRDLALAYAIAEEERNHEENGRSNGGNHNSGHTNSNSGGGGLRQKRIPRGSRTGPGMQYPGALSPQMRSKTTAGGGTTSPTSPAKKAKAPPSPRPIKGQLVSVHLARLPDGKNFGITITQSPLEGVRVLNLANKHEVLEVNDRIVEVNGIAVTGLSVREVAECVRKRKQDRILSLVVEKPRKSSIGRFFMRSEQRQEESLQRHVFGGSYPRTLHLTVIGAIGLPSLYPSAQYPNSYVEVTNRSTSTSFRTTVCACVCSLRFCLVASLIRMAEYCCHVCCFCKRDLINALSIGLSNHLVSPVPFYTCIRSYLSPFVCVLLLLLYSNRWCATMHFPCGKNS